jgi:hypothetical protein
VAIIVVLADPHVLERQLDRHRAEMNGAILGCGGDEPREQRRVPDHQDD